MVSLVTHQWRWPLPGWYWSQACGTKSNLVLQLLTFRSLKMPKKARNAITLKLQRTLLNRYALRVHLSGWRENRNHTCRELMQCCIQRWIREIKEFIDHEIYKNPNLDKNLRKHLSVEIMFNDFHSLTTPVYWMFSNYWIFSFSISFISFLLSLLCCDTLLTVVRIFTFQWVIIKVQLLSGTKWCNITLTCCSVSTLCHNGLIWKNQFKALN